LISLIGHDEPAAFQVVREQGRSTYFITCDHGGNLLPHALGTLGLRRLALERHIAWDIGAAALAGRLAHALDAYLIVQTYSRLAIDCNRLPQSPSSIVPISEWTPIPGNRHVSPADANARRREIFQPYHDCIERALEVRKASGRPTILVALHSFTPMFKGESRPWHVGVLYNRDARLAHILLALLRAESGLIVGDNQPYAVSDESDYAIPLYGERRGIPHVEIEIRQDLLADEASRIAWAQRLVRVLGQAEVLLNKLR
jgi:predicted N-formylglutamate amidohydrolase